MVLEVARKQAQFFSDGTKDSIGMDKVPTLDLDEQSIQQTMEESIHMTQQQFQRDALNTQMISKIRNIERFCNQIAANKLLWTPEILIKLQMPHDLLSKFEKEREIHQKERQGEVFGNSLAKSSRRDSYADLESF